MIPQNELFKNTNFPPIIQTAIYKDMCAMREFFPNLFAYQFQYPTYVAVLIQGTVTITINGSDCFLPISLSLPPNFPDMPPAAYIPISQGFPLITSNALHPDGNVITQVFFQWIPRQSRLSQFVNAITQYFSGNPPFTLQNGRRLVPNQSQQQSSQQQQQPQQPRVNIAEIQEQATAEALSIIEETNAKIRKAELKLCESKMNVDLAEIVKVIQKDLGDVVDKMENDYNSLNSQPLPEVPIDPELEQMIEGKAKTEAFEEVKNVLRDTFENGVISPDEFLTTIRDMSRNHFTQVIAPSLSS